MISRLGRFEIQNEIGHGGFGKVFRAFDPVMNRVVAVKVLTATGDANALNRFKNEATAAGNLRHENIITVYEFGQEGHTPYLVMEYLNGEDLQQVIKSPSQPSLYQKIRIMDQVADGLDCAHRNGVLHRDVKPANIMVVQDGPIKIMDFGIARLTRDTSTRLTQQGYLIGTVVYMAPELFGGSEVDALCDIWSYGVILYELLAGKNPFQTGNVQAEMYRICNLEPEPLPAGVCPPDLQAVVNKLLSRQREFRYQSLEDTRFDLQPILKNLEKAEADRLLNNAQQLLFQRKWDEALSTAREARRMDPQNGTARIIFERAQTELQRQTLRPRIDDLLRQSQTVAEQRKFDEAIELLDKARRLDTANENVQSRLQELRLQKQRHDEAVRLAGEAEKDFRNHRLTSAFERATEAAGLDPANQEAQRLLEKIRTEMQARETERAAEEEIRRARGLMAIDDLDGAAEALHNAEAKYPGRPEARDLQKRVSQLIAERERRRDFSKRLEQAKSSVRSARYSDAVSELEQLLKSFPNEVEATDLLSYARQELRAKQRSDEIKQVIDSAVELGRAQRFDEAVRMLEAGLKRFPDDLPLTRQLRSILADKQAFDRDRALQEGIRRCEALRQRQQFQECLELIAKLRGEHSGSRELAELESRIVQEKSQAERAASLRNALEQAQEYLNAGQPDHASMVLESAILNLGAERALEQLLEKVHAAQQAERERRYIQSELKHATGFEQSGDITTSLKIIDDALLRSPNSAELLAARERLFRLTDDRERARRDRAQAEVKEALDRKEWPKVIEQIDEKTKIFGPDCFAHLNDELQRRMEADKREQVAEGRRLLNAGQVREAQEFVSAHLLAYSKDPEVESLGRDIIAEKRRREKAREEQTQKSAWIAECLRSARGYEDAGDLAGASRCLEEGRAHYPDDAELAGAQERIGEQLAAARKRELLARIQQALDASNWSPALQLIEQARQEFPNDPALIPLQAAALDQRRAFLESAAAAIRNKLGANLIEDARTLFDQNLAALEDQGIVKAVAAEIASAEAQRDARMKADARKRAFIAENLKAAADLEHAGDHSRAITTLQKALKTYQDDPLLTLTLNRLQAGRERVEKEQALASAASAIKRDLDRGNWEEALKRLDEVRAAFPDSAELKNLEEQARKRRDREIQTLVDKARSSLSLGNPAEAERILTRNLAPFAHESAVMALAKAIQDEKARQGEQKVRESLIETARNHTAGRRFAEADTAINDLAARYPDDPEVARLRSALEAAREQDRKEKLYRSGRIEADQLLKKRNYAEAVARIEYLLTQFPDDNQLQQDLKGALAAETRTQSRIRQQTVSAEAPAAAVAETKSRGPLIGIAAVVVAGLAGVAYWTLRPAPPAPSHQPEHAPVVQPPVVRPPVLPPPVVQPPAAQATAIDIQPAFLRFPYKQGGASPPAQKLTVTGPANVEGPRKSAAWLTVKRLSSGTGRAEFEVQVLTNQLPRGKGSYHDVLVFPGDKKVPVEVVADTQEFDVQPRELSFHSQSGTPSPAQPVTVFGSTDAAMPQNKLPWLRVTRSTPRDGKTVLLVQPSPPDNLAAGNYTDDLIFPQQKNVHVNIVVKAKAAAPPPAPSIDVEPTSLKFMYRRGGAAPPPQNIAVTGATDITEPKKPSWVHLTRSGTGFAVQIVPDGLDLDHYSDDLVFTPQKKVHIDLAIKETPARFALPFGHITWSGGILNQGDDLVIKQNRVLKGPGHVDQSLPKANIVVDRTKLPAGIQIIEEPTDDNNFTLRLRNVSAGPIYDLPIHWTRPEK